MGTEASSVKSVMLNSQLTVVENVEGAPSADSKTVTSDQFNLGARTLSSSTTIPVTIYSEAEWTLDEYGAATIDLTDAPGTQENVDGTGLKVQFVRIRGQSADNGVLSISPGASNPYNVFGAGNSADYPAGCTVPWHLEFGDTLDDVTDVSGVGASQIDLAGTAGDVFEIEIGLG